MPTYRTFICVEEDNNSVQISFLDKTLVLLPREPFVHQVTTRCVVAGISTTYPLLELPEDTTNRILESFRECSPLFNAIFYKTGSELFEFVQSFPELSEYYEGMLAYPPYQKLLLHANNEETK
jgi:hypothetical protein